MLQLIKRDPLLTSPYFKVLYFSVCSKITARIKHDYAFALPVEIRRDKLVPIYNTLF